MQLAMVAAGFTPGEADQLRRAMAAWKRRGGLEHFERRLIDGMRAARLRAKASRSRSSARSRASANTAFPESHAASFALLVYAPRWLKCHEPAASPARCSTASRWVSTRRRSWCAMRASTASKCGRSACARSDWDCTLERRADGEPALRLGLRMVKGRTAAAERIVDGARHGAVRQRAGPRRCAPPWIAANSKRSRMQARCASLPVTAISLSGRWPAGTGAAARPGAARPRATPLLAPPTEGQNIAADYRSHGLTLGRHPLALLREQLAAAHIAHLSRICATCRPAAWCAWPAS